jgi:type IV pilus assembly protein PilV
MKAHLRFAKAPRGFSLIEVMVAVLVISIGLLGIAKMQALSLSNTGNSRIRALAALEAASLASALQADRTYWTTVPVVGADLTAAVTGASITAASDGTLTTVQTCTGAATVCTPAQMAAYDFQSWVAAMNTVIQNDTANIDCTMPPVVAPATTSPVTCTITISWTENLVNSNSAQTVNATTQAALQTPTYVLIVQP